MILVASAAGKVGFAGLFYYKRNEKIKRTQKGYFYFRVQRRNKRRIYYIESHHAGGEIFIF